MLSTTSSALPYRRSHHRLNEENVYLLLSLTWAWGSLAGAPLPSGSGLDYWTAWGRNTGHRRGSPSSPAPRLWTGCDVWTPEKGRSHGRERWRGEHPGKRHHFPFVPVFAPSTDIMIYCTTVQILFMFIWNICFFIFHYLSLFKYLYNWI